MRVARVALGGAGRFFCVIQYGFAVAKGGNGGLLCEPCVAYGTFDTVRYAVLRAGRCFTDDDLLRMSGGGDGFDLRFSAGTATLFLTVFRAGRLGGDRPFAEGAAVLALSVGWCEGIIRRIRLFFGRREGIIRRIRFFLGRKGRFVRRLGRYGRCVGWLADGRVRFRGRIADSLARLAGCTVLPNAGR